MRSNENTLPRTPMRTPTGRYHIPPSDEDLKFFLKPAPIKNGSMEQGTNG